MASTDAVSAALFEWIGSFHLRRRAHTVEDLNDGILIWDILRDIDANYFTGELPDQDPPEQWVRRWQNLKFIHKCLVSFLSEICGQPSPNIGGTVDLQSIAKDGSLKDLNLLLKLIVLAAISSGNAAEYVQRMPLLSVSTQEILKEIITQAQDISYDDPSTIEEVKPLPGDESQDLELAFEERVGKVVAEKDKLQHEKDDLQSLLESMHERHAELQEKHDSLQRELEETQERLLHLRSGAESVQGREESKAQRQESLIESLESKNAAAQEQIENLRRQNETLRLKNESAQKLQDDYDEIKIERDQLIRRANTAEKYKQKLQQSQDWEKHNAVLQAQIEELKKQLRQSDSKHFTTAELEREIDEYKRMLPRIEQDRHDLSEMKKQLEYDNHALVIRLEQANQQHARDAATIDSLRERLNGGEEGPGTPTTPRQKGIPGLDDDSETLSQTETTKLDADALLKEAERLDAEQAKIFREASELAEQNMSSLLNSLQKQLEEAGQLNENSFIELQKEFGDRIESSNRSTQRVIEYAKRQSSVISTLRSELSSRPEESIPTQAPEETSAPPPLAPAESLLEPQVSESRIQALLTENTNLHQELKLMTSAWYNLSSRLQSPNVNLARGRATAGAEPRSWLARTRKEVDRVMMGVGR